MGSIDIFNQNTNFMISLFSLALLFFATVYTGRSRRLARLLADRMGDRGGRVCDLQKSGK